MITVYQAIRTWHWRISPLGNLLNKATPTSNTRATICTCSLRTKLEFSITIPMNQEFTGPPVTPFDDAHQTFHLPVPPLWHALMPHAQHQHHKSFTAQFQT